MSLFIFFSSFFIYFVPQIDCINSNPPQDIFIILENVQLIKTHEDRSTIEVLLDVSFEWEDFRTSNYSSELVYWNEEDEFGIFSENMFNIQTSRSIYSKIRNKNRIKSKRLSHIHSEDYFNFTNYPFDRYSIDFRFTSTLRNTSSLVINPHYLSIRKNVENSEWTMQISKSYVQWVVQHNETFEQAVFEFILLRNLPNTVSVTVSTMYLLNFIIIFLNFPLSNISNSEVTSVRYFIFVQFIIAILSTNIGPKCTELTSFDLIVRWFLLLAILIELVKQLLPSILFYIKCCPIEANPNPPRYPSPSDQFSLDTERSRCHAALDSARAESVRSPRVANFDMCLAEVKFTMSTLNEVLNLHASAEWRRNLWITSYRRFEILTFILFQLINFLLFHSFVRKHD